MDTSDRITPPLPTPLASSSGGRPQPRGAFYSPLPSPPSPILSAARTNATADVVSPMRVLSRTDVLGEKARGKEEDGTGYSWAANKPLAVAAPQQSSGPTTASALESDEATAVDSILTHSPITETASRTQSAPETQQHNDFLPQHKANSAGTTGEDSLTEQCRRQSIELESAQMSIQTLKNSETAAHNRAETLEKEAQVRAEVQDKQLAEAEARIELAERQLESQAALYRQLKFENNTLSDENKQLKHDNTTLSSEIEQLKQANIALSNEDCQLTQDITTLSDENDQLRQEMRGEERTGEERGGGERRGGERRREERAEAKNEHISGDSAAKDAELEHLRAEVEAQQKQLQLLRAELEVKDHELAALRGQLAASTSASPTALASELIAAAQAEADKANQKARLFEINLDRAEAESLSLQSQIADLTLQLDVARKGGSIKASPAHSPSGRGTPPAGASMSGVIDYHIASTVSLLRRQLREADAEREAIQDVLASMVPLPAFVHDRAAEYRNTGGLRSRVGSESLSKEDHEHAASPAARPKRRSSLTGVPLDAGTRVIDTLRALASERPIIMDAVTHMDLLARALKVERDRLAAALDSSKSTDAVHDASTSSLRRQLANTRSELAALGEAKDELTERVSKLEAELRARSDALHSAQEIAQQEAGVKAIMAAQLEEARTAQIVATDECETLRQRVETLEKDLDEQARLARTQNENAHQMALAAAASQTNQFMQQVQSLNHRVAILEAELECAHRDLQAASFKASSAAADVERSQTENAQLSSKLVALEMALASSEAAQGNAAQAAREARHANADLQVQLDELLEEQASLSSKLQSVGTENASLKARVVDLEARGETLREQDTVIDGLRTKLALTESALATARTDAAAFEHRISALKDQARHDIERAHAASARAAQELHAAIKWREEDAQRAAESADAASRTIADLQADLEASNNDAAKLRDRCRALQGQLQALANEVQEHRDAARRWHDDSIQAKADLEAEVERSDAVIRALAEQLESIQSDFFSFLSLFHGSDNADTSLNASNIDMESSMLPSTRVADTSTIPKRSTAANVIGRSLANSLEADIGAFHRRLEVAGPRQYRSLNSAAPVFTQAARLGSPAAAAEHASR